MPWKKIYSTELKLEIVQRYQKENIGLETLAKEYHLDKSNIQKWKAAYAEHGIEGLTMIHGTYSVAFRVYLIEYMYHTEASLRQTAAHFNIPSIRFISCWQQIYCEK